jgi:sulfur carrier protein
MGLEVSAPAVRVLVNGEPRSFPRSTTVADAVARLGLAARKLAVERNGAIVPRSLHAATTLTEGDVLEIVAAVGGG